MVEPIVEKWVQMVLKNEDLYWYDYRIDIQGKTNKDEGYLGNITFVTVIGKNKSGTEKVLLDLVVKTSKEGNFRNQFPIQEAFEKEIYIYDIVNTASVKFQREKGVEKLVEVIPRCYATETTGKNELLILENLKPKGYNLTDRKKPMNFDHVKIILEAFGKWHALSLALKHQQPQVFKNLIAKNNANVFSHIITKIGMFDLLREKFNYSKKYLEGHQDVLQKVQFDKKQIQYILTDLFFEEPEHHVILHGDCWTNNFMFKYEENSNTPLDVRFIDFQCSGIGSPVFDLSFFLYCCCSKEVYEGFESLMKIYHDSLSSVLKSTGSDPEQVFSFETLMRHWKKFSCYGIVMCAFLLTFSLCEEDEAPDFADAADKGNGFINNVNVSLKNDDAYLKRMKHNILHFAKNI